MEMFGEQPAESTSTELVLWEKPQHKHIKRRLGKHALTFPDGFVALEPVESQFTGMREDLEARIIDQPGAIDAIIEALERSDMRLPNDNRPIANFAFLGPTGVGKSETAKVLAQLLGNGSVNLIKIDCSNFSHGHEVSSLTGSPPGFIGHEKIPVLDKGKVEKRGTVILFDEVEKGTPELYNLMLQIMGDGELKLNNSKTTSFRDTVIILTSNLGAREMAAQQSTAGFGFGDVAKATNRKELEKTATKSFEKFFTPEFINRLNKLVVFHPLSIEGLGDVLDVKVRDANVVYEKQLGVRLSLSEGAKAHLVAIALKEAHNGARPVVRAFEDNIQTSLGRYVGAEVVQEGTEVRVFHSSEAPKGYRHNEEGELIFTHKLDMAIEKESTAKARTKAARKALPPAPESIFDEDDDPDFGDLPPEYN